MEATQSHHAGARAGTFYDNSILKDITNVKKNERGGVGKWKKSVSFGENSIIFFFERVVSLLLPRGSLSVTGFKREEKKMG